MSAIKHADLTRYPKLYGGTCWGRYTGKYSQQYVDTIIANRNNFAKSLKLKSKSRAYRLRDKVIPIHVSTTFDHPEQYRTEDKYTVFVISPYKGSDLDKLDDDWIQYPPLYAEGALTFYRVVNNKGEVIKSV